MNNTNITPPIITSFIVLINIKFKKIYIIILKNKKKDTGIIMPIKGLKFDFFGIDEIEKISTLRITEPIKKKNPIDNSIGFFVFYK